MGAQPLPQSNDEQPEMPLSAELIGKALGVPKPDRLLSSNHIKELNRRGKGLREGWLHIKISGGKVIAIADTRVHILDL